MRNGKRIIRSRSAILKLARDKFTREDEMFGFFKVPLMICLCIFLLTLAVVKCENETISRGEEENNGDASGGNNVTGELVEQARSLAHRTLKRLMFIAPAIFFKLGIAFTLLILVTLAAVNNGFIGFLILVVGLSSVLARLQNSSAPVVQHLPLASAYSAVPHVSHSVLPHVSHYQQQPWIDRSDSVADFVQKSKRNNVGRMNAYPQSYDSNSDLRNTGAYFRDDVKV